MLKPLFLQGPSGHLFVNVYSAENSPKVTSWVLFFPPFAEEMNKSRPMVSRMAREMASAGYNVVIPDVYGTGDSEGDFSQASWEIWKPDIAFLLDWLQQQGAQSIICWGLRTGCLLAADVASNLTQAKLALVKQMVFWQPVLNGKQYIAQFLRLRVAAAMMSGDKESVASLRDELAEAGFLEVAGYRLSAELIAEMDQLILSDAGIPADIPCHWFEVVSEEGKPLLPVSNAVIEQWHESGVNISGQTVVGEPFWSTQEIAMAPALLGATLNVLDSAQAESCSVDLTRSSDTKSQFDSCGSRDFSELPVVFECEGSNLSGVLHTAKIEATTGIVLVVGGPQYRVGSHRQFVQLARNLQESGIPVLRFDCRGMGDSEGAFVGFEGVQNDIRSAVDFFQEQLPDIREVILWGLCDAATASAFYAPSDSRIAGLVLLNPWVRSEQGEARAFIKHYYLQRLLSKDFWRKVLKGEFRAGRSLASLGEKVSSVAERAPNSASPKGSLSERMYSGLSTFKGRVLFVLSGNDLTAAEFKDEVGASRKWQKLLSCNQFDWQELPDSDHTFSRSDWKEKVAKKTIEWVKSRI